MTPELRLGLANLHDAFLNASLQRQLMQESPVEHGKDPTLWFASNRARLERSWVTFLYVLVESWRSAQMKEVRAHVASVISTAVLEDTLSQGDSSGDLDKMRATRDYMCHRDRRHYWDPGRLAVLGRLEFHDTLHMEFSKLLLAAMRSA